MTGWSEERPVKADCGHWVADHDDLVGGLCPDCAEFGPDTPANDAQAGRNA